MKSEPIIADIAKEVNIWERVRQGINRFGKRLIISGKLPSSGRWPTSCRI